MKTLAHKRSLTDLLLIAHAELHINPTITVYTFDGGQEQRRPANPEAALNYGLELMVNAVAQFTLGIENFGAAIREAMAPALSHGDTTPCGRNTATEEDA